MEPVRWRTDEPHSNNTETMHEYIHNHNMIHITYLQGSYAEGVNGMGDKYEMHAGGDGDSFNHIVTFKLIND